MLFLLNDALIELDPRDQPPLDAARFGALQMPHLLKLGAELFSEDPLLPHTKPERAKRLAMLIKAREPEVNAALFVAQTKGCQPDQVISRIAAVSIDVMASLNARSRAGGLNPVVADREVWRRMAA